MLFENKCTSLENRFFLTQAFLNVTFNKHFLQKKILLFSGVKKPLHIICTKN